MSLVLGCGNHKSCKVVHGDRGDIIIVDKQYALVILKAEFMREIMGSNWSREQIFYGHNLALDPAGDPMMVTAPLVPLGRGFAMFMFSGTEWEDLQVPLYSIDTRSMCVLTLNLRRGTIELGAKRMPRRGEPKVSPDGQLHFE